MCDRRPPHLLCAPLAIPRRLHGDERGLVELRDRAEDLPHQDRGGRVLSEMIRRARRHEGDADPLEVVVAGEPHGEVAREAVGAFDQDRALPLPAIADRSVGSQTGRSATGSAPRTAAA
jgi:hypothetical protein